MNAKDSRNNEYSKNSRSEWERPGNESISPHVHHACTPRTVMQISPIKVAAATFFNLGLDIIAAREAQL